MSALAVAQLTVSHSQLLLPIAVKGFRATPTFAVSLNNAVDFPMGAVGNQHFGQLGVAAVSPYQDDPHRMFDLGQADGRGEVPLAIITAAQLLAIFRLDRRRKLVDLDRMATHFQIAIGFQVADIGPRFSPGILLAIYMVQVLGIGKIAVKRELGINQR